MQRYTFFYYWLFGYLVICCLFVWLFVWLLPPQRPVGTQSANIILRNLGLKQIIQFAKTEPTVSVKGLFVFSKKVIHFCQNGYSFLLKGLFISDKEKDCPLLNSLFY